MIGEASNLDAVESSLKLWVDASNIDGVNNSNISDGDAISTWVDLSGNGNHGVQSDSDARRRLMGRQGFNGKETISFDGIDDGLN